MANKLGADNGIDCRRQSKYQRREMTDFERQVNMILSYSDELQMRLLENSAIGDLLAYAAAIDQLRDKCFIVFTQKFANHTITLQNFGSRINTRSQSDITLTQPSVRENPQKSVK